MMFERMLEHPYYPQLQTFNPTVGVGSVTVLGKFNSTNSIEFKSEQAKEVALAPARKMPLK